MRIPNVNLGRYQKSYDRTKKVIRTITKQKSYIQKHQRQEVEMEQEILASLKRQKEFDKEYLEKLTDMIDAHRASEIQYYALILYGIKLNKEKVLEEIKARKAK